MIRRPRKVNTTNFIVIPTLEPGKEKYTKKQGKEIKPWYEGGSSQ